MNQSIAEALQRKVLLYDKTGDEHYNVVSAFIKTCADPILTQRFTGWPACWKRGRSAVCAAPDGDFAAEDIRVADPRALQSRRRRD